MKRKKKPDDKAAATTTANSTNNRQSPGRPPPDDAKWLAGDTWSETELDALTTEYAEQAKPLDKEDRGIGFGYGQIASELHAKILNGGKRVPDGEDTYARLAKKLIKLGIKKSRQRLRALAQAYELYAALGGEGKAPDLTPDHFVEVAKDGLTLEQKREILDTASEKKMSASGALRKYVRAKLGELGKEPERDAGYWLDWFEKSFSRGQSILTETCVEMSERGIEIPTYTRDQMIYTAVFLYQFATGGEGSMTARTGSGGPTRIAGHKDKIVVADGCATNLSDIIVGMVDPGAETFADLFGGTNVIAARALRAGMSVTTNDWRRQSWYCARAMLENRTDEPTDEDADRLVAGELVPGSVTKLYGDPLGKENALEFDRIIRNARGLLAEGHEVLAVAAFYGISHVILESLSDYHLHLSADKQSFLGNAHLAKAPLVDAWRRWLTCEYPRCLFGSDSPAVQCHARDAVELAGEITADCIYVDTLYPGGGYDHLLDFRMLEDLCDIFEGVDEGRMGKWRPLPKHRFGSRQAYIGSMTQLLLRTASCPQLIMSINTSSDVCPEELVLMCRAVGRTCDIHRYAVPLPANATKLHHNPNHECLLDCRLDADLEAEVVAIRAELHRMAQGIGLNGGLP